MRKQTIDYTVPRYSQYHTRGDIRNIDQKGQPGFTVEHITDQFQFEIKLKIPSIVSQIQVRPIQTLKCTFYLIQDTEGVLDGASEHFGERGEPKIIIFDSAKRKVNTARIRIVLYNALYPENDRVGLKYLLVKGQKGVAPAKKKEVKSTSYRAPYRAPVKTKQLEIFAGRVRTRGPTYDEQMKKAIEQSKKEQEREKMEVEPYSISQPYQYRDYELSDFEHMRKNFDYVNMEWLQAQRKIEIQKGVVEEERLSSHIQVRHLHNKKVLIDGAQLRRLLENDARKMGATIVNNLQDNCLYITARVGADLPGKVKKFKGVKVLKPDFIKECMKCNAYMNERDYFHELRR